MSDHLIRHRVIPFEGGMIQVKKLGRLAIANQLLIKILINPAQINILTKLNFGNDGL